MDILVEAVPEMPYTTTRAALHFIGWGIHYWRPLHMWLPNYSMPTHASLSFIFVGNGHQNLILCHGSITYPSLVPILEQAMQLKFVVLPFALLDIFMGSLSATSKSTSSCWPTLPLSSGLYGSRFLFNNLNGLTGGILHLFNHALMKGGLFLVVGCVVYRLGHSDINLKASCAACGPYWRYPWWLVYDWCAFDGRICFKVVSCSRCT